MADTKNKSYNKIYEDKRHSCGGDCQKSDIRFLAVDDRISLQKICWILMIRKATVLTISISV